MARFQWYLFYHLPFSVKKMKQCQNWPPLAKLSESVHEGDGLNIFDSALDSVVFQTYK